MMRRSTIYMAMAVLACAGSAQAKTIGFISPNYDQNYQILVRDAAVAKAKELGADIQTVDAKEDVGTQLSQMQNFIASGVDAIVLSPVNTDATPQMTKMAADAGVALVYVVRQPVDLDQLGESAAYVGSDSAQAGTLEAKETCKQAGGKGQALLLMGFLQNQDAQVRSQMVRDAFKGPDCKIDIVSEQEAKWQRTDAQNVTANVLSSGVKFNIVIANNDEMALGAIQALKAANAKDVIVAGIDATPDGLAAMQAGDLSVTVFQNAKAQGARAIETALALSDKKKAENWVNVPFELVTKENLGNYTGN